MPDIINVSKQEVAYANNILVTRIVTFNSRRKKIW
jgi:hypothetical protein